MVARAGKSGASAGHHETKLDGQEDDRGQRDPRVAALPGGPLAHGSATADCPAQRSRGDGEDAVQQVETICRAMSAGDDHQTDERRRPGREQDSEQQSIDEEAVIAASGRATGGGPGPGRCSYKADRGGDRDDGDQLMRN
jgi:hypothetical protein